jgi:Lrp/AsnC family transcriptional regulator, leucine-responsive regulatory protein
MRLDSIDHRLLELLQQNARMTQIELAASVGLSQPAVAERMRKLEQEGFITGYAAHVDAHKLGKDITAFIGVTVDHPRYFDSFTRKILGLAEVLECHRVAGEYSYLLKVKTENTVSLDRFISELLRTIPGVTRSNTTIVLSSAKETTFVEAGEEKQSKVSRSGKAA